MSDDQIPFRLKFRADSPFAAAERHAAEVERLNAEIEQLWGVIDILGPVGRMYLDALDADPENEMLTLGEVYRVSEVREAVDRWEAVASGRDVGEGETG